MRTIRITIICTFCFTVIEIICVTIQPDKTYTSLYPYTAFHIEVDRNDSTQLVAASPRILGTAKWRTRGWNSKIIDGSDGYFEKLTGFSQINSTHIIVADHEKHCLRIVDRNIRWTRESVGLCSKRGKGYRNGNYSQTRFYRPFNVIEGFSNNTWFVTDHHNGAVRQVNLNEKTVSTFYRNENELYYPIDLKLDKQSGRLYITLRFKLIYIDVLSRQVEVIADDFYGDKILLISPSPINQHNTELVITTNPDESSRVIKLVRSVINLGKQEWEVSDLIQGWYREKSYSACLNDTDVEAGRERRAILLGNNQIIRTIHLQDQDSQSTIPVAETTITQTDGTVKTSLTTDGGMASSSDSERDIVVYQSTTVAENSSKNGRRDNSMLMHITIAGAVSASVVLVMLSVLLGCRRYKMRKFARIPQQMAHEGEQMIIREQQDNRKNEVYAWVQQTVQYGQYTDVPNLEETLSLASNIYQPIDDAVSIDVNSNITAASRRQWRPFTRRSTLSIDVDHTDSVSVAAV